MNRRADLPAEASIEALAATDELVHANTRAATADVSALAGTAPDNAARVLAIISYLLIAAGLLLVMLQGLLPGLLCVCIGFLVTRWLARAFLGVLRRIRPGRANRPMSPLSRGIAATLVALAPIALLSFALVEARDFVLNAPGQYLELIDFIARTIVELKQKIPPELAALLPEGAQEVQRMVAEALRSRAGSLAITGRAWLGGVLLAYVGLLVGSLAAAAPTGAAALSDGPRRPLAEQLRLRVTRFGEAFGQIVAAQFWIASFNTLLTAIFLLAVLPLFGLRLPFAAALITLTFVAGLIPIVGNLVCNTVIFLVGLSVSPMAALACLVFLILIHKAEYFINAKVVGLRTHVSVWELLAVMFVAEAVFGPAGLVAAPLFYAYAKKELLAARLV